MTAKKPTKKTTKKTAPKKKAPAKKAAPKSKPKAEAVVNEKLATLATPVVEEPKHGTVIYAADVKKPSTKKKFFAWFRR
jgi:hypothetical protein